MIATFKPPRVAAPLPLRGLVGEQLLQRLLQQLAQFLQFVIGDQRAQHRQHVAGIGEQLPEQRQQLHGAARAVQQCAQVRDLGVHLIVQHMVDPRL
ncbi:hypothetical protein QE424_001075 [Stenotrophomonas rhizophila]|uniref:Uncharacterized protein n=1 Tax=Stenotrophomonas rhizophila TaxID=216778 RepID=A0AAP5AGW3_9GAMM|nr:hypothetical protein [Stenotrophomonas rhizophila]MDQ1107916.1 hypothetical protein [Stenotrophomonas rhizophila]